MIKITIVDLNNNVIAQDQGALEVVTEEFVKEKTDFEFTDDNHTVITEVVKDENLIASLYQEMVKDIYDQMYLVFGTRNDASAQATASTFEAMLKRPEKYVDNVNFNSESEVTAFASEKLNYSDAYAIYRMNRINQYRAAVAAL